MNVGQRIKTERELKGLSQTDLANYTNISKQTLYKYENGIVTNIPSDKIEVIAKILQLSPAYLMGWETNSQNDKCNIDLKKQKLIDNYEKLNDRGKEKLLEYSDDLVSSKKYIKNNPKTDKMNA